ncbi:MAG: sulfite exporter TauE/SafE family protein [Candidatus Nanopelagicales bacterium]
MDDISLLEALLVISAGIITGIINGLIGGGSLVSYLALTSVGVPPVLAASTNTVGVITGNPAALITPVRKRLVEFRKWFPFALITLLGSLLGGMLLITLPEYVFEFLIPLLLLIAGSSVWIGLPRTTIKKKFSMPFLFLSGIYNGYFGPGQGILNLSILYRSTTYNAATLVILKNYIITLSNIALSLLFIVSNRVIWSYALLLWISVFVGGWASFYVAKDLNEKILRIALSCLAFLSALYFLLF